MIQQKGIVKLMTHQGCDAVFGGVVSISVLSSNNCSASKNSHHLGDTELKTPEGGMKVSVACLSRQTLLMPFISLF